jgi:ferredoxin
MTNPHSPARRLLRWGFGTCLWLAALPAAAVQRFPRPDFATDYAVPVPTTPAARGLWLDWIDVAVLAGALVLAGHLAHRVRTRRGLWLLALFCLGWFGFWRRGCVCAVGSLQNLALGWGDAGYAVPLTVIAFFALPLVWTLFSGRTFCAAVCPLGAIQELVLWRPVRTPVWLSPLLGLIPWFYLAVAVLFAASGAGFLICRWDPFVGLFRLGAPLHMALAGGFILVLGLFIGRPYCRFLCPYGALLGLMSRFSRRHVTITPAACVQCRLCENACPYDAIRAPVPAAAPETRAKGVRRLALILGLAPLIVLAAAATGWTSGRLMARAHPRVAMALELQRASAGSPDGMSLEREAFLTSGLPTEELDAAARSVQRRFAIGGIVLGALLALTVVARLLGLSLWRSRTGYEPDRARCFSCGRCFSYCPVHPAERSEALP